MTKRAAEEFPAMIAYAVLAFGYVLSQFYRSVLAVLTKILETDIGATASDLSVASGAWFMCFALMQFPIGYALDRYGPRRTTAYLVGIVAAAGAAAFAMAQTPLHLVLAMALIGAGCSPVLMAAFFLFARNFSVSRFATLGSTFVAIGTLGNIIGTQPLAAAVDAFGWRETCWFLSGVTAFTGLLIALTMKDPEHVAGTSHASAGLADVFKIRALWPILPCILLGYSVAAGVRGLWAGPLMADIYGLDTIGIGQQTLYMAIALSVGSLAYGPLDRLFDSRKRVVMTGNLIVAAACAVFAFAMPQQVWVAGLLLVCIGFFGASFAVQLAHGRAFIPAHLIGRGVTLMNFFSIGGVGLMQFTSGAVVEHFTDPADPAAAYHALFALYAFTLLAALAFYSFSRDAKPSKTYA
jgi:MFS family permease